MRYKPLIWTFMTRLLARQLKMRWAGDVNGLIRKAKPIYKDLLNKVEGITEKNPMSYNISMGFVFIAVWLASDRTITPDVMGMSVDGMFESRFLQTLFGMLDMNTEKDCASLKTKSRRALPMQRGTRRNTTHGRLCLTTHSMRTDSTITSSIAR